MNHTSRTSPSQAAVNLITGLSCLMFLACSTPSNPSPTPDVTASTDGTSSPPLDTASSPDTSPQPDTSPALDTAPSPDGQTGAATVAIAQQGGTVSVTAAPPGRTVDFDVPAAAVAQATTLQVTVRTDLEKIDVVIPGTLGGAKPAAVVEFGPDGQKFAVAITIAVDLATGTNPKTATFAQLQA